VDNYSSNKQGKQQGYNTQPTLQTLLTRQHRGLISRQTALKLWFGCVVAVLLLVCCCLDNIILS